MFFTLKRGVALLRLLAQARIIYSSHTCEACPGSTENLATSSMPIYFLFQFDSFLDTWEIKDSSATLQQMYVERTEA